MRIFSYIVAYFVVLLSCTSCLMFKVHEKHSFAKMDGYEQLNGVYRDSTHRIINYLDRIKLLNNEEKYSSGIYKIEMANEKTMNLYNVSANDSLQFVAQYKGKYDRKKNYFNINIESVFCPLILVYFHKKEKLQIGINTNKDLDINYQSKHESWILFLQNIGVMDSKASILPRMVMKK